MVVGAVGGARVARLIIGSLKQEKGRLSALEKQTYRSLRVPVPTHLKEGPGDARAELVVDATAVRILLRVARCSNGK